MKISKLFHWLYASVMFLPLLVAPIFAIYSHRHTIDSYEVTRDKYQVVDIYNQQLVKNGRPINFDNWYTETPIDVRYLNNYFNQQCVFFDGSDVLGITYLYSKNLSLNDILYLRLYYMAEEGQEFDISITLEDNNEIYISEDYINETENYQLLSFQYICPPS